MKQFDILCNIIPTVTLCNFMDCSTAGFPVLHHLQSLLKLMSIELATLSKYLIYLTISYKYVTTM